MDTLGPANVVLDREVSMLKSGSPVVTASGQNRGVLRLEGFGGH